MNQQFRAPKGIPEYLPPRSAEFRWVRDALSAPARHAGYGYVELPVFEDTGLFEHGVGESTDVVAKEMYTFTDRGERSISLRPEGTAGVMRCVIEHNLHRAGLPVKLWYEGQFFRAERPQRGRYRQLQQVGVEAIGSDDPAIDAEVIAMADDAFRSLGLTDYDLQLSSLGCTQCRPPYRAVLQAFLSGLDLDEATRERAAINPLRVLDDKRQEVQTQLTGAPLPIQHLCVACQEHFDQVVAGVNALGIAWVLNPFLVRGLDYYTRTAFEFTHRGLGAQSGIGGGGRYDGLMESLGGPALSGIGYGLGVDRTLLAIEAEGIELDIPAAVSVFGVAVGEQARQIVLTLITRLRRQGISADLSFDGRSLKAGMKAASRSGARWALIVGDDEVSSRTLVVKDLQAREQSTISMDELEAWVQRLDSTKPPGL